VLYESAKYDDIFGIVVNNIAKSINLIIVFGADRNLTEFPSDDETKKANRKMIPIAMKYSNYGLCNIILG